jgi:hypothetical protein
MPTQAVCGFLKRQASAQVADLPLHSARRALLLDSPQGVIGRFAVATALIFPLLAYNEFILPT